jgi:hypothetical protein
MSSTPFVTDPSAPTVRDTQRRALDDLIRLAQDCGQIDAAVQRDLEEAKLAAARLLKQKTAVVHVGVTEEMSTLQARRAETRTSLEAELTDIQRRLDEELRNGTSRIQTEADGIIGRLKKAYQDALWLAESVKDAATEAADKRLKLEIEKAETHRLGVHEVRDQTIGTRSDGSNRRRRNSTKHVPTSTRGRAGWIACRRCSCWSAPGPSCGSAWCWLVRWR